MSIVHQRFLTGPIIPFRDIVQDWGDDELQAREDAYGYRALGYERTGDIRSRDFVMSRLSDVRAEIKAREELREQFPDHPALPARTAAKEHRSTHLTNLIRYLKSTWPIERFMTDQMGLDLNPSGPNRMKGCCPFHDDHNPSMAVYTDQGSFHCFGCQANGDIFDAVGLYFHLDSFRDQVHRLVQETPGLPANYSSRPDSLGGRIMSSNRRRQRGVRLIGGKVVTA